MALIGHLEVAPARRGRVSDPSAASSGPSPKAPGLAGGYLLAKLKGARDRKRASGAKVEGRKGYRETEPELIAVARRLARKSPKTGEARSLREIAAELAAAGYTTAKGIPARHV